MTDQRMDERLRTAGEQWRAEVAADTNDRSEPLDLIDTRPPNRRRLVTILSAAAVIVLVAVGASVLATRDDHTTSAPSNSVPAAVRGVTWTDHASGSTMVFLDRAVRISSGCTSEMHAVTVDGSLLRVSHQIGIGYICSGLLPSPKRQKALALFDQVTAHGAFAWSIQDHALRLAAHGDTITLTTNGRPVPNIEHQTWRLESLTDERGNVLTHPSRVTLTFDQGGPVGFHGSDGCNTISGEVRSTLTTITFVQPKITLMGCGPESPETKVIDTLLKRRTDYQIIGDELVLSRNGYQGRLVYGSDTVVKLVPPVAPPPRGAWQLSRIATRHGWYATHSRPVVASRLTFDGLRFVSTHRCSTVTGNIVPANVTLYFEHVEKTPHSCPATLRADAREDRALNSVLRGQTTFDIEGNRLTITHLHVGALTYQRVR